MQHPTKTSIITHKHKHRRGFSLQEHGQLSAVPVTSIIVSNNLLAQSSPVSEKFWQQTSQLANVLLPIATSDPAVGGWSVTWLLRASIIDFFSPLLSFAFATISNGINTKVGTHATQISAPSLQPYLTITISFTVTISTT